MIYTSLRCVLKMSLSLFKIRSHLFGKPVLVCRTLEKASTLVQLRIHFKVRKKKENKIHERKGPKHVFLKINYAEITYAEMYKKKNKSTAIAIICLCFKVIVAKMSGQKMTEEQITILNRILIISMHIASLVKRPGY